ncbi:MAG: branched-chain amino acid ABC transporter permease [Desulfobacterales bacterium]|nr:branched-chain amino acid ABC transporter permease [Desulfobacterales bacterium]
MPFEAMVQSLIYGIFVGSLYGLIAVGLSLVFGVMNYLNVAHGTLLMIGSYVSYWLFSIYGIDPFITIPIVMASLFLLGSLLYIGFFSSLAKFHSEVRIKNSLLVSFGLMLVLDNVAILLWTADERTITTSYSGMVFDFLDFRFPYIRLLGLCLASMTILALHLLLTKTYFGKAIRAASQDWEAAALMGIKVSRTYLVSFAISSALAGMSGALFCLSYAVTPVIGEAWSIKALIVVILAGLGRIGGVFFAGLLLGLVEAVSVFFVGASYQEVVGLVIFVLVLMFRPQGLFTR